MERSPDTNISPSLGGFGASQVESIVSCWDGGSSPSRSDKVDTSPHFSLFTLAMLQNPGNHPAVTHDGTMGEGPATLLQGRYIPYEPLHDSAHMMHEAPPRPTSSENLPALNPDPQSVTWSSNSIPYGSEHKLTEKRHWSPPMRDSAPVSHGPFPALNRMTDSIEARISNAPYHTLLEYNLESSHNDESAYYGTLHRHEISPRVSGSNSVYLHSLPDAIAASLPSAASPAQPHEATVEPLLLRVPEDRSRGRKLNRSRSDPGLASPSRRNGRSRNSTRYEAGLDVSTHAHNKPLRRAATVGKKHTLDGCWDCRERKKGCERRENNDGPCLSCERLHIKCRLGYGLRRPTGRSISQTISHDLNENQQSLNTVTSAGIAVHEGSCPVVPHITITAPPPSYLGGPACSGIVPPSPASEASESSISSAASSVFSPSPQNEMSSLPPTSWYHPDDQAEAHMPEIAATQGVKSMPATSYWRQLLPFLDPPIDASLSPSHHMAPRGTIISESSFSHVPPHPSRRQETMCELLFRSQTVESMLEHRVLSGSCQTSENFRASHNPLTAEQLG